MTLPAGGTAWPPPPHGTALAQMAVWSAWWVGDPEGLAAAYNSASGGVSDFFNRPAQSAGGVVGAAARLFWGRPTASGQRKSRLHVPLAADIATASADLLFSEPPQFLLMGGNDAADKRVDEVLNAGTMHAAMLEAAEIAAALGGGWLRLVWDTDVTDHVMVDAVSADAAIGEWRWGLLQAVTFFTEYATDTQGKVLRHLERHEPGRVLHGLYEGDRDKLGRTIPLADHPSTEPYAELVDADGAIATGVKTLTASYVANMRPQRRWRKIDALRELGRSDFDGVEALMDALDETYTSWMRDIRLGKARLIVPEFMLKDLGKGKGAAFDEDQEIYAALNIAPVESATFSQVTPHQFDIRVDDHRDTAAALVDEILRTAGYSPSTFGAGEEGGVATATEVVSRERQSARTRDKKSRYWSQALDTLLTTWLELDAHVFSTGATGVVTTQWPEAVQADPESLARTVNTLRQAQAASTHTLVAMLHPDWNEEAIKAETDLVMAESGMAVPDIGPLPGD